MLSSKLSNFVLVKMSYAIYHDDHIDQIVMHLTNTLFFVYDVTLIKLHMSSAVFFLKTGKRLRLHHNFTKCIAKKASGL